ncbi:RNA methyltransferase [Actinopolyspora erythraea]|uniref:RNA methyltransferase n=2 Tax=Actinopolyspora erythraea TaxID=414996 RepID=A0ABR4X6H0_9ACTN|nr:RNA methyltransferase [Actinopolyspora erythraea]KGI82025.1 RNA methyltransferase [Actinopolyspora erythraea]
MTERSARVSSARKLTRRAGRERAGMFLAEGANAVLEALAPRTPEPGVSPRSGVREVLATSEGLRRVPEVAECCAANGVPLWTVTERAAAALSETVTPQGLVAVCELPRTDPEVVLAPRPSLVVVLLDIADPGNAGTVLRVADAAGAGGVLFAGDTVDPYNGKAVRASTGSLFHLPLARERDADAVLAECRRAGLLLVGAEGEADSDLHTAEEEGRLDVPTAWVFGSEAHGLGEYGQRLDTTLRVPIYGRAESLNLATAAAVCLYASARRMRRGTE